MTERKKQITDLFAFGKIPPQAKDLENAVLGAILLDKEAIGAVIEILQPECFYAEQNKKIFKAILSLYFKSNPIDLLTVGEQLRKDGELEFVGGQYYLTTLTNAVVSSANILFHSRIIYEKYLQRELIQIGGGLVNESFEDEKDVFEIYNKASEGLRNIGVQVEEKKQISVPSVSIEVIKSLHERVHNARDDIKDPNEVYTRLHEWDAINGSLFPGLFILAARPGMGKGVLMTEMICRMGKEYPIGVVNGEMTNKQLMIRVGCNLKNIDNELWKKEPKEVLDDELKIVYEAMQEVQTLKLHIEDSTLIHKIVSKIRMWVNKYGVKAVMIDFLSLIRVPDEMARYMTDVQKLNYIMDVLRNLCKELNVPIFLFCQLNRELYKRGGNKEPNLSDLKGSGNIEEFAYQICFLHRPEYYEIFEDDMGESTLGLMYLIIAKHRDGRLGRLKYKFLPQFSKIVGWESAPVLGWLPKPGTEF